MELYLLRHGAAEQRAPSGRDIDRRLTPEGESAIERVILQAKEAGCAPARIVASTYLRTQQTARLAARQLGYTGAISTSTRLTPDSAPNSVWEEAREWEDAGPLLFVAHEPLLSAAASWMLGETRVIIEFRPGTLARIDFATVDRIPRGELRWKLE